MGYPMKKNGRFASIHRLIATFCRVKNESPSINGLTVSDTAISCWGGTYSAPCCRSLGASPGTGELSNAPR